MAIAKMKLVNIHADIEQLQDVLLRFIELKDFHPIEASQISKNLTPMKGVGEENTIKELYASATQLQRNLHLEFNESCSLKMNFT